MFRLCVIVRTLWLLLHHGFGSASSMTRCWNDPPEEWQDTGMDMFHPRVLATTTTTENGSIQEKEKQPSSSILEHFAETNCQECSEHTPHLRIMDDVAQDTSSDASFQCQVLLILTEHAIHRHNFLSIATGLLWTESFQISIVILSGNETNDVKVSSQKIEEQIWSGIPCDHPVRSRRFDGSHSPQAILTITSLSIPKPETSQCQSGLLHAFQPFGSCAMQMAANIFQILSDRLTANITHSTTTFDVLITDPSLVGVMWWSERNQIPTVALTEPSLIPLAVEHDPAWSPFHSQAKSWWNSLSKLVRHRFNSLALTKYFIQMNSHRRAASLPFLRTPIDYLQTVAVVLMEFAPLNSLPDVDTTKAQDGFALLRRHWGRTYLTGPLQPACIPCSDKRDQNVATTNPPASSSAMARKLLQKGIRKTLFPDKSAFTKQGKNASPALLVVPPTYPTPIWTRTILQGLHLARESLHTYDDCEWDSFSCHKHFQNFSIIWLVHNASQGSLFLPPVTIPGFSQEFSSSILNSLAQHPETVLVLMPCDRNTALLEHSLGMDTICLDEEPAFPLSLEQKPTKDESNPRELAAIILKKLRARQQQQESKSAGRSTRHDLHTERFSSGGLSRVVDIIQIVAETNRKLRPWEDTGEMQRITTLTVLDQIQAFHEPPTSNQDYFGDVQEFPLAPYDSLTIFVAWSIVLASILYICLYHFFYLDRLGRRSLLSRHPEGLFTRPTLGDAWSEWLEWYQEQPQDFPSALRQVLWGVIPSNAGDLAKTFDTNPSSPSPHQPKKKKKR